MRTKQVPEITKQPTFEVTVERADRLPMATYVKAPTEAHARTIAQQQGFKVLAVKRWHPVSKEWK